MEFFGNRKVLLLGVGVVLVFLIAGMVWTLRFQKEYGDVNEQGETREQSQGIPNQATNVPSETLPVSKPPEKVLPTPTEKAGTELINTEKFVCNNESYVLDVVLIKNDGYFNDIYKSSRLPENLLVHEEASGDGLGAIRVLAIPKERCDRVYLTRFSYETGAIARGIYEWRIGESIIDEVVGMREFRYTTLPYPHDGESSVSSDGNRVLATPREDTDFEKCELRVLYLYHLNEHTKEILVRLPRNEIFNSGFDDELGFCVEINYGWLDESTIYYDVYDATRTEESHYFLHPLLERRTLKIE